MSIPRGLSDDEQAAWAHLAQSVTPMVGRSLPPPKPLIAKAGGGAVSANAKPQPMPKRAKAPLPPRAKALPQLSPARPRRAFNSELDSHWNRKLKAGQIAPDYTLDLHGHTLDTAYDRITTGLDQARAMGARVVLVIAGRERPVDPADRGSKRGAIRAKLLDWIAASHHADSIAAVRRAHIRHGGDGALYLVLRRL